MASDQTTIKALEHLLFVSKSELISVEEKYKKQTTELLDTIKKQNDQINFLISKEKLETKLINQMKNDIAELRHYVSGLDIRQKSQYHGYRKT